jgi:hypothetical protein
MGIHESWQVERQFRSLPKTPAIKPKSRNPINWTKVQSSKGGPFAGVANTGLANTIV